MNGQKTKPAFAIGLLVFLIGAVLVFLQPFSTLNWKIADLFFRPGPVNEDITIIAIDDKSLSTEANLGRFKDWPRSFYAQLLRAIAPHKPAVVAFDLDFREGARGMSDLRISQLLADFERRIANGGGAAGYDWYSLLRRFSSNVKGELTHPDDADFQKAIDENGRVVFTSSLHFTENAGETRVTLPIYVLAHGASGYHNVMPDRDSVLRRFTPATDGTSSFPLAILQMYKPESGAKNQPNETRLIAYTGRPGSYRTLSFADVLAGKFEPAAIEGKIVIVGGTAPILQDMQNTPTSENPMSGVEINANIVQQLLEGKSLAEQGKLMLLLELLILALFGSLLLLMLPLWGMGAIIAIVLFLIPAAGFGMYQSGLVMNIIYPEFAWILTSLGVLGYRNETEIRAKREIKKAFSHYVSPIIVDELAKNPELLKLGGKRQKISVMFSDIVGFTTLAEKLSPEDTVALLNDYLTSMTEVVFAYHGTLDKYQGDAIMALFGAPLDDPHHAVNAVATALGMRKALTVLHEKWNVLPAFSFKDELTRLDFRVGIATGPAVVGNVGSEKRFDYTAIGDIVNLGSRLESVNKKYGTHVLVDKETFTAITENHNPFVFRKLDTVRVKGKQQETEIFEVMAFSETVTAETASMLDDFENGRLLYTQRNFLEAKQYFEAALGRMPNDSPSRIYLNRCNFFIRKPPEREWSSVVNLEEK